MKNFILTITFFLMLPLAADVYLLRDLWQKSSNTQKSPRLQFDDHRILSLVNFEPLYEERISINGGEGLLTVGLLNDTYINFLRSLQGMNMHNVSFNDLNTVIKFGNLRFLVYNAGDFSPAICFRYDVPAVKYPPPLPPEIPNPGAGSIHNRIVAFPDRQTIYVSFSKVADGYEAFRNCHSQLTSNGYRRVDIGDRSAAGFFMSPDGGKIVLVNFNGEKDSGFIYMKERKK